ncbi:MAG: winged helix-turn-helix domain-containing protein, partial [Planctomycetota bacterium]
QFKVLRLFLQRPRCVLTREEIQDAAWGYSHFLTRRDVNGTVAALRDKIESDPDDPEFIHTVEGIGYKFEMPEPNGNDPDS